MSSLPTRLPIFLPGLRMHSGEALSNLMAWFSSNANGLTAFAGGGQANATKLTGAYNRATTVASAADSFQLPVAQPGLSVVLINRGANACQVFGAVGFTDTINGTAGSTGISVAAGGKINFVASDYGIWDTLLSA